MAARQFNAAEDAVNDLYQAGLEANAANYAPLTPSVFLDWSADVYPDRLAIVHRDRARSAEAIE